MRAVVAVGRRHLPHGWSDLGVQVGIWLGFGLAYQVARGVADRDPTQAFANALRVIDFEQRAAGLYELTAQNVIHSSDVLAKLAAWTYWNSEFTVISATLLFVYTRRHHAFQRFRNAILATNVLGLIGYVALPTAPPRMFPDLGFDDTLSQFASLNHGSGLINFVANPYAAMPSLHAADALIVGFVLFAVCRNWLAKIVWALWPAWVWFSVMATGNHFLLDVVAGVCVALVALAVVYRRSWRGWLASRRTAAA
jgi:membrane-associated phospholipid phosphatase